MFANGNVLYPDDIDKCLIATGADAYMSAEPQLHNPAIFASTAQEAYPFHSSLASEYLAIVASLKTPTSPSAIKAHMFKLMHPALSRETDLRERLGKIGGKEGVESYQAICTEMTLRMKVCFDPPLRYLRLMFALAGRNGGWMGSNCAQCIRVPD